MYPTTTDVLKKKLRPLIIFGLPLIFVFLVFLIWRGTKFHVISTDPNSNNVAVVSPFFKINFSKNLNSKGISLSASVPSIINSYSVQGKTLYIKLNEPLVIGKSYVITVSKISSTSGSQLTNLVFKFTGKDIPSTQLSTEQQQTLLNNQANYDQQFNDPILAHLPYGGLNYSIAADIVTQNGKPVVTLDAKLLLYAADVNSGPAYEQAAINTAKQGVTDYIKSLGLDPSKYTINYTVVQPTT